MCAVQETSLTSYSLTIRATREAGWTDPFHGFTFAQALSDCGSTWPRPSSLTMIASGMSSWPPRDGTLSALLFSTTPSSQHLNLPSQHLTYPTKARQSVECTMQAVEFKRTAFLCGIVAWGSARCCLRRHQLMSTAESDVIQAALRSSLWHDITDAAPSE